MANEKNTTLNQAQQLGDILENKVAELEAFINFPKGAVEERIRTLWKTIGEILLILTETSPHFLPYKNFIKKISVLKQLSEATDFKFSNIDLKDTESRIIGTLIQFTYSDSLRRDLKRFLFETIEELYFASLDEQARQNFLAFNQEQLQEIFSVSSKIAQNINPHTLLIFLGRSALWLYYCAKVIHSEIPMLWAPISSALYEYKKEHIDKYIEFLTHQEKIISTLNNTKEIIVIDLVDSGRTLLEFCEWLKIAALKLNKKLEFKPIMIHKNTAMSQLASLLPTNQDRVVADHYYISPGLFDLIAKKHRIYESYTPGKPFYPKDWLKWHEFSFDLSQPPLENNAQQRVNQITQYAQSKLSVTNKTATENLFAVSSLTLFGDNKPLQSAPKEEIISQKGKKSVKDEDEIKSQKEMEQQENANRSTFG